MLSLRLDTRGSAQLAQAHLQLRGRVAIEHFDLGRVPRRRELEKMRFAVSRKFDEWAACCLAIELEGGGEWEHSDGNTRDRGRSRFHRRLDRGRGTRRSLNRSHLLNDDRCFREDLFSKNHRQRRRRTQHQQGSSDEEAARHWSSWGGDELDLAAGARER